MLVLLDSTVLMDYLCGRPAVGHVLRLRESGVEAATSVINVEEIVRGLRPTEESAARALAEGLHVLPVTVEDAWRAGEWRREYGRAA